MVRHTDLPQAILRRLRQERLFHIPREIQESLAMPPARIWDVAFQCTIHPNSSWIEPEVQTQLATCYQVATVQELLPRYVGLDHRWGAVVSPRVLRPTMTPTAHIEQWFISKPEDLPEMFTGIQEHWPFPCEGIALPIPPDHQGISALKRVSGVRLEESAYIMNWGEALPPFIHSAQMELLSIRQEQVLDGWWPSFQHMVREEQQTLPEDSIEDMIDHLRKILSQCFKGGGILNIYDAAGLGGHISWHRLADLELLIPDCYQISYILVRPDLRGQGMGKYLCHLAARHMALDVTPLVCTRVRSKNVASRNMLKKVGGHRIMDIYIVS